MLRTQVSVSKSGEERRVALRRARSPSRRAWSCPNATASSSYSCTKDCYPLSMSAISAAPGNIQHSKLHSMCTKQATIGRLNERQLGFNLSFSSVVRLQATVSWPSTMAAPREAAMREAMRCSGNHDTKRPAHKTHPLRVHNHLVAETGGCAEGGGYAGGHALQRQRDHGAPTPQHVAPRRVRVAQRRIQEHIRKPCGKIESEVDETDISMHWR